MYMYHTHTKKKNTYLIGIYLVFAVAMTLAVNFNEHCTKKGERGVCVKAFCKVKSPILMQRRGKSSQSRTWKRRSVNKKRIAKLMQLKVEMREISEEQSSIKEEQGQVKEKFQAIESECRILRQEAILIMQQSACTRLRLAFMFEILKARENNDFEKAAELTHALRELIAQQNQTQALHQVKIK